LLTVGSLFSGIGGLDLGLERAGMRVIWQAEIEPYCRAVLKKRWPSVKLYGNVGEIDERTPRPDLVCGGFPCQPVSVAGKRLAQRDERWLWPEFARVLRILRPRLVLVENVPGLAIRGFGDVLGDLAALGYDAEWDCISAAALGAPHLRNRIFLVGSLVRPSSSGGEQHDEPGSAEPGNDGEARPLAGGGGRLVFDGTPPVRTAFWSEEPCARTIEERSQGHVDRLKALGNAVVPQVAEWIGVQIMKRETG
jgi:DNA (cytosine-5)-methyltransferase 1